ncbi:MAG: glutaredoxin 3 [Gammaproteobacteria bacterium]|jgi:glutaredoxin 3|nr:glutaredoxin 3 [Gammaproteobacteria bacterium]
MPQSATVIVYTTAWCGYCAAAKRLLNSKQVTFEEIAVDGNAELRAEIAERSGRHTVPQIFIDGRSVGGYDDIAALNASGELDRLLGISP